MGTVDGGFGMAGIIVVDVVMVSIGMARSARPNQISLARSRASSFTINLTRTCQK
jgi:hypothetical protein